VNLLARLERRLPLLVGGARDAPARQRTLRETISWSHDLLDEEDRVVFRRFSVFNGGCTLEDAEAVLAFGDVHESAVIDRLESLAAKSLIRADGRRFSMLALMREFAGELLDTSGEAETLHRRHAEHYSSMVSRLDLALRTSEQLDALARLESELDNLRAALGWSVSSGERRIALAMCASMCWYWWMRSRNSEAQHWLALVLADSGAAADRDAATVLAWAGFLANEQGRNADASSLGQAGLTAARQTGDAITIVEAILLFSPNRQLETDSKTVHKYVDEAIEVATRSDRPFLLAWVHSFAGEAYRTEGREDDALVHFKLSIEFGRASGDRLFLSTSLMNSAHIHLKRANVDLAHELLTESLDAFGSLGMHWGVAYTLIGLAGVAVAKGRSDKAVSLLAAVDGWFRGTGIQIQPADRADFDQYLGTARSALDEGAFAGAWKKGQTLSLDDAILFATDGAKAVPAA
jgi:tetratricopeptide (TPR) repeat protein